MLKKRLILVGGGHSHALFLRMWSMDPLPDVEVVLVSPHSLTPYSGMLPGYIAGHYTHEEMHIDLLQLCIASGANFILSPAIRIDGKKRLLYLKNRPPLPFDFASINIGSEPKKADYGIGIKPMADFLDAIPNVLAKKSIAIIGGGAGGVELALSLKARFGSEVFIRLIQRDSEILSDAPAALRKHFTEECARQGVDLHCSVDDPKILADECSIVLWATGAKGPDFLRQSSLALDDDGFALTDENLKVQGEDSLFAVGDCARIEKQPRPRAGVYAVRLAKPLFENVKSAFRGESLRPARLQKKHLALITNGRKQAVALRGNFYWRASWLWPWKDRIDRKFMRKFSNLPPFAMAVSENDPMRCLGCGAKVEGGLLKKALQRLSKDYPKVFASDEDRRSLSLSDDVSLLKANGWLMQSLDYFPAFFKDLYTVGKIACYHAAGDILAKGGRVSSALALAVLPHKEGILAEDDLYQLLSGVAQGLEDLDARLIGGHSAEGMQAAIGLQIQGPKPDEWRPKGNLKAGDVLIMTKALGTGLILAALMRNQCKGPWLEACLQSMQKHHLPLVPLLRLPAVHASTDVTGFGLLGHLAEMIHASGVHVELSMDAILGLPGTRELLEQGISSTLAAGNLRYAEGLCSIQCDGPIPPILFDPQTSGGLLLSLEASQAEAWVQKAREFGFHDCRIVAKVLHQNHASLLIASPAKKNADDGAS